MTCPTSFNLWAELIHRLARRVESTELDYIVTPRVNHSHLERVLNARK